MADKAKQRIIHQIHRLRKAGTVEPIGGKENTPKADKSRLRHQAVLGKELYDRGTSS